MRARPRWQVAERSIPGRSARARALGALILAACALAPGQARARPDEEAAQLHYPTSAELGALLRTADKARTLGELDEAVTLYRAVLDQDEKLLCEHPEAQAGEPRRLVGVTEWAIRGLRALPAPGRALFQEKFGYRAESALKKALQADDPYLALARVYELYPIARQAPDVLRVMAERCLERGELQRGRTVLRRLLAHHAAELADPVPVHKKLLVCALGLGDAEGVREQTVALRKAGGVVRGADGGDEVVLHGAPVPVGELIAAALEREAVLTGRYRGATPTAPFARGDPQNRAAYHGEAAFGGLLVPPQEFESSSRFRPRRLRSGNLEDGEAPARHLAVVHEGLVFASTSDSLFAMDLFTGRPPERRLRRPDRQHPPYEDDNDKVQLGPCIGQGMLVASFVERIQYDQSFRGIPIKVRIPTRKLCGFDLDDWRWGWDHARLLQGTPLEGWSFPTTPVASEGRVYAAAWSIEGYVNANVAAFDVRTGQPLWSTLTASGQVEQTMFGEQATEPLCVPVAVHDGVVYQPTSLGCVAALDADTGRPLWVTEYDSIEVRPPKGYYADHRNIKWENNAPVVESGVLVVAPLDAHAFYGFDLATGRRRWKARQRLGGQGPEAEMRFIMGAANDRIVLGGGHDVRCVEASTGLLRWRAQVAEGNVAGRGCLLGSTVCVPLDDGSVVTYDLESGKRRGQLKLSLAGNLLPCGRALVVVGNGALAVHKNGAVGPRRDFK